MRYTIGILTALVFTVPCFGQDMNDEKTAFKLAKLFYAARAAIGENPDFTADPTSSTHDKSKLLEAVRVNYKRMADLELDEQTDTSVALLWQAVNTVIDKAMKGNYSGRWKDSANFPGKLIPARFGHEITQEFNKIGKNQSMKWTTSDEYLVNPSAKADEWEREAIKSRFQSQDWKQGAPFSEMVKTNGKASFRYALPEYFKTSCMVCHGGEMGKLIHHGKTAAGSGTFGGALSLQMRR